MTQLLPGAPLLRVPWYERCLWTLNTASVIFWKHYTVCSAEVRTCSVHPMCNSEAISVFSILTWRGHRIPQTVGSSLSTGPHIHSECTHYWVVHLHLPSRSRTHGLGVLSRTHRLEDQSLVEVSPWKKVWEPGVGRITDQALVLKAWRREFDLQNPHKMADVLVHTCNPGSREAETGGALIPGAPWPFSLV